MKLDDLKLDHIDESNKKKKKKTHNIIVGFIIFILATLIFYLRYWDKDGGGLFSDPTMPWYFQVLLVAVACLLVVGMFFIMSMTKSKTKWKQWLSMWIVGLFTYVIIPGMFLSIILLGAITAKYPPDYANVPQKEITTAGIYASNSTVPFDVNVNKSMSIMGESVARSFTKLIMELYNLGAAKPTFWIFLFIAAIAFSIYMSFPSKSEFLEQMDAQQLIDSIDEKDYQELERYEQKVASQNAWWDKIDKNEKAKTIIIVIVLLILLILGIGFWFWG